MAAECGSLLSVAGHEIRCTIPEGHLQSGYGTHEMRDKDGVPIMTWHETRLVRYLRRLSESGS